MSSTGPGSHRIALTVSTVAAGIALLAGAAFVENHWEYDGVFPSILVNLGSTSLLAAALVWLERQLERNTERAVEAAVDDAREETSRQTRAINDRIDLLADQMRDLAAAEAERVRTTLEAAEATPTYASVVAAFELAKDYQALYATSLVVPTSTRLTGPHVSFSWAPGERRIGVEEITWDALHQLRVTNDYQSSLRRGRKIASVTWGENDRADVVGNAMTKELMAAGEWDEELFDWPHTLRSLVAGLRLAVGSKRRDRDQPHLHGELIEVLSDRILLTKSGVETRDGELLIAAEDVPRSTSSDEPKPEPWTPNRNRPEWLTEEEWRWLVQRAFERYRFRSYF